MNHLCVARRPSVGLGRALLIGMIGLMPLGHFAQAQAPAAVKAKAPMSVPPNAAMKDPNVRKEKQRIKNEMLKGSVAYSKQDVEAFYLGWLIPQLTSLNTPEVANDARKEIYEDIDRAEKASDNVLNEYNATLMKYMKAIADGTPRGDFQPSAAINATLIVGRLNASRAKGAVPAVPLAAAMDPLLDLYLKGKNDGVRAAALWGLERHIDIDVLTGAWKDARRQEIADKLLASLKAPKPANRNLRTDAWLRGRAIELLMKIKHSKEAELYQFAVTALANPKSDPLLVEKAFSVIGAYPAPELAPAMVNPALTNSLQYVLVRAKDWKKGISEAQYMATGGSDGDAPEVMEADDTDTNTDDGSGTDEGMVRKKPKKEVKANPFEKQPADVKARRRAMHELLEPLRYGLTGTKISALPSETKVGLATLVPEGENRLLMGEVLTAIKDLQDMLNSPTIADRSGLAMETVPKVDGLISAIEIFLSVLAEGDVAPEPPSPAPAEVTSVTVAP